jgi:hypothetical protein
VFDLHGSNEDDLTAALAFALSRPPALLKALLAELGLKRVGKLDEALIEIQKTEGKHGRTDIEITIPSRLKVIIEAKAGQAFPGESQLKQYKKRLDAAKEPSTTLVALTNVVPDLAKKKLDLLRPKLKPLALVHISWRQVKRLALAAKKKTNGSINKRVLADLAKYLEGVLQMETKSSNYAYVLVLATGNPKGWGLSWREIVNKKKRYFYPVGKNWPDPPNYLAFRYDGKLQSIHHVEGWDVFTDPHEMFPEAPSDEWQPHYNFKLGPAMRPHHDVKNGPRIKYAMRRWCMIDTLLTCKTITDALDETMRREKET